MLVSWLKTKQRGAFRWVKKKAERVLSGHEGNVRAETELLVFAGDTSNGRIFLVAN